MNTESPQRARHQSEPIVVPCVQGQHAKLSLTREDLRSDGAVLEGDTMIALNGQDVCTVEQAGEWVAALQRLIEITGHA